MAAISMPTYRKGDNPHAQARESIRRYAVWRENIACESIRRYAMWRENIAPSLHWHAVRFAPLSTPMYRVVFSGHGLQEISPDRSWHNVVHK